MKRRQFMKMTVMAGGGLAFSFSLAAKNRSNGGQPLDSNSASVELDALIKIAPDNKITMVLNRVEMGQGVNTGLPMMIAEELEADWNLVEVEQAQADESKYGIQSTTASISVYFGWEFCREAGAKVRAMLISAAANVWQISAAQCHASESYVYGPKGRRITFGEVASIAANIPIPALPTFKEPSQYKLLGRSIPRKALAPIVSGDTCYGIDVEVPNMLVASIVKCPVFGGKAKSWFPKNFPGIVAYEQIDSGIVAVAESFWQAKKGLEALTIEWEEGDNKDVSSENLLKTYSEKLNQPGSIMTDLGSSDKIFANAKRNNNILHEADYEVPFMAHATMEPVNATADVTSEGCTIWAPTQTPDKVQSDVSLLLGLPKDKVEVNVTMIGGGFGRKSYRDFVIDAVQASQAVGRPVKLIRTREEDIQQDLYRPACSLRLKACLDSVGLPLAFRYSAVGPSVRKYYGYPKIDKTPQEADGLTVNGIQASPYAIGHYKADAHTSGIQDSVPVGILRSIAHSYTCFARECFIDELASLAGQDPLTYRMTLLKKNPRAAAVLKLAAEKSSWGKKLPAGHFQGCALFTEQDDEYNYNVFNAQVVELSIESGQVVLHRVVTVGDFGLIIHPDLVKHQLEGGVIFGMGLALYDAITLENGAVKQSNFHDYRLPRMNEAPKIEAYLIQNNNRPSGVGEKGVPAIIPAICNAIYKATGKPLRQLPIKLA